MDILLSSLEFLIELSTDTIYGQIVTVFVLTPAMGAIYVLTTDLRNESSLWAFCKWLCMCPPLVIVTAYIIEKIWGWFPNTTFLGMSVPFFCSTALLLTGKLLGSLPSILRDRKLARHIADNNLAEQIERYRIKN